MNLDKYEEKLILGNFSFRKPKNFIEKKINSENTIKLENINKKIIIYFSIYGRDGNYAQKEYDKIKNNIVQNKDLKLFSSKKFKNRGFDNYNLFFYNKLDYVSIYLFHKYNKTFRISFVMPNKPDFSLKLFKEIRNSLTKTQ